jgi:hypothetical protein
VITYEDIEDELDLLDSKYDQPLKEILMNRNAIDNGMIHLSDNVYFNKMGKDISSQIHARLSKLASEIETQKSSVAEVCKKREVDLNEVLKDKDVNAMINGDMHEDALYASSRSLSNAVGSMNNAPMTLAKAVMEDLKKIIKVASFVVSTNAHMEHLTRVQKNLNSDETYKLTYANLLQFGF